MSRLDDKIKGYYDDQQLSSESVDRILELGEHEANGSGRKNKLHRKLVRQFNFSTTTKRGILVFAASFLVAVIIGQFYHFNKSTSELVLAEIAMNHNKQLESEYLSDSFQQLQAVMSRLDFNLQAPTKVSFKLIGGRYCSIQGKLAAQLKVKLDGSDEISTLYVAQVTDRLQSIPDQKVRYDNVSIRLWKDGGYFYGLASETSITRGHT